MTPEEVLLEVLTLLEGLGCSYMITGSFAGNVHGIPRATQDADVVVEADRARLESFLKELKGTFYVSPEAARDALARESMFNIIHLDTGFKIDLIFRKSRPFSKEEFRRRRQISFHGRLLWFTSPEDTILSKLEWSKLGSSERQFQDALSVARLQGEKLDAVYLKKWADPLGVRDLLNDLLSGKK